MGFLWLAGLVALGIVLLFLLSRRFVEVDSYTTRIDDGDKESEHSD